MSLNLRISRPRPRQSRGHLYWLLAAIILALGWVAWLKGWQAVDLLAYVNRQVLPHMPVEIPPIPIESLKTAQAAIHPQPETAQVAAAKLDKHPKSEAYTAALYTSTGKDTIPWPNIEGRTRVEIYTVQSGDSLWGIASKFGLDIDTLRWSNPELERNPDELAVNTKLRILPVLGVYHDVEAGDTIESVAAKYGVAAQDISGYPPNAMFPPYKLKVGTGVIVPFGRKGGTLPKPALSPEATLAWPIVGSITTDFSPEHEAFDIGAPYGSVVYAAAAGTITYASWATDGYGYTVVIDHGNGLETWYNHLKGTLLSTGAYVERGTPVGEVGSTGHSTGPHVHFEVRVNGRRVNPLEYLPGSTPQ